MRVGERGHPGCGVMLTEGGGGGFGKGSLFYYASITSVSMPSIVLIWHEN